MSALDPLLIVGPTILTTIGSLLPLIAKRILKREKVSDNLLVDLHALPIDLNMLGHPAQKSTRAKVRDSLPDDVLVMEQARVVKVVPRRPHWNVLLLIVVTIAGAAFLPFFWTKSIGASSTHGVTIMARSVLLFLFNTTAGLHLCLVLMITVPLIILRETITVRFSRLNAASKVLSAFAGVVVLFALSALITYRKSVSVNPDRIYEGVFLFLAMVCGMFVQVIATNFTHDQHLLTISPSQLVFPLMYSPFVYYPLWGLSSSSPKLSFSLYAAFVNGYFWESVVSAVKSQREKGKEASLVTVPVPRADHTVPE